MAVERKAKKDKEIVLELENQIRDIRQQLAEQLRCLDQRLDCHVGMLMDLQEYYRRHSEVEVELSRSLDKLGKQLSVRQRKDPSSTGYSTSAIWQTLLDFTRQQSRNRSILSDIFNPLIANKLVDIMDDIQRIYKRCREMVIGQQDDLFKVLTELENSMKTYHTYHGNSQQAETKLLRVQSQRVKVDQQNALSKRFINYDKKSEKKQAKYTENKMKALKARNDYLLCIDSANAAFKKYFDEDFPKLVEKMDFGYHMMLTQTMNIHLSAEKCLMNNHQDRISVFINQMKNIAEKEDYSNFYNLNQKIFLKPDNFEFQPHKGDDICQISAQKAVQEDMITRLQTIKQRIDTSRNETQESLRTLCSVELDFRSKIFHLDIDVQQLFKEEKSSTTTTLLKSPTADREKRKDEKIKQEENYFTTLREYMKANSLTVRLDAKYSLLQKALGDGNYETLPMGTKSDVVRKRPPSLPPKPKKTTAKKDSDSGSKKPRLFGGTIEEYVEATGNQIPSVVLSCIRIINLYGMHHQGIFRVSGSQNDINNYKQQFEKGNNPLTTKVDGDDINSVAGLLKLYFRELKEPLFPPEMFNSLIASVDKFSTNEEESVLNLRQILSRLPRPRMIVLRYLFSFLNHLSEFSDENMMDAYNLAICFGPTLLPAPASASHDISSHVYVNELIKNVIIHQEALFPHDSSTDDVVYEKCIIESYGEKDYLDSISDDDLLNSNNPFDDEDIEDHEAVAEYDYQGRTENELTFQKGDVLFLINRVSSEWWQGELMGQKGLIPDKYILLTNDMDRVTNLKKVQAKSSDCLLSPDNNVDLSSSSSLDRSVSQPNVTSVVPVPSLAQLGISANDRLDNVTQSFRRKTEEEEEKISSSDKITQSIDSALAKVYSGIDYFEKLDHQPLLPPRDPSDLDVLIPVGNRSSSSPPVTMDTLNIGGPSVRGGAFERLSIGGGGVSAVNRKSTSFRTASEMSKEAIKMSKGVDMTTMDCEEHGGGGGRGLHGLTTISDNSNSGDRQNNSKSRTLPLNLPTPQFGKHGAAAGFDSKLLEEINTYTTFPPSQSHKQQKSIIVPPPLVPSIKPRPPPPVKKTPLGSTSESSASTAGSSSSLTKKSNNDQ